MANQSLNLLIYRCESLRRTTLINNPTHPRHRRLHPPAPRRPMAMVRSRLRTIYLASVRLESTSIRTRAMGGMTVVAVRRSEI